jgi:O-antigen/teichoic acid export membrane protein
MPDEENVSTPVAARGMLQIAAKEFVSAISSIVFFVVIARLLPDIDELGILVGLQTTISMFVLLSSMGVPFAATRFISTYIGSNQKEKASKLYPLVFFLGIALSAIFSGSLFIFSPQLSEVMFHNVKYAELVQIAALDVFFLAIANSCVSLLDSAMEFNKIARISIITSILKYSLSFTLFMSGLGLDGIVLGLALGDGIGVIVFVSSLAHRIFGARINMSSFTVELRAIMRFAISLYGWIIINYLLSRMDVYMLMLLSTLYMVGIYGPSVFVGAFFFILLASIDQALVPLTSRVYGRHGTSSFKFSAMLASRFLLLVYFPLGFAIAASSPTLVDLVLGQRFAESAFPMAIIVIGITLTSPGIVANNLLRSAGYTGIALKAGGAALAVQILASVLLIPYFGVMGASTARFLSYLVLVIPIIRKLDRIGGLDFDRSAFRFGVIASAVVSLAVIVINEVSSGPYSLLMQYLVAILSYFLLVRISHVLNKNDAQLVDKILMGRAKWLTLPLTKFLIRESG